MSDDDVEDTYPNCHAVRETPSGLALVVRFPDYGEHLVPQSQIGETSDVWKPGHQGKLVVSGWWSLKVVPVGGPEGGPVTASVLVGREAVATYGPNRASFLGDQT